MNLDLGYNRNGKIARLPRELRERINQALYDLCTALRLVQALNQMPEVKAVLAQYFGGRPLKTQNIYEWKQGGYRDWLRRREILEQKHELTANARDLADTANGMADSLFSLLTLDYAGLLLQSDGQTPEQIEKRRKGLSVMSQDIVRLHRCHIQARRVAVQETRLERDEEKTGEQLHHKFMEWTENPEIRKACILGPLEQSRRLRQLHGLPPAPEDPMVEMEVQKYTFAAPPAKKQTKCKPIPTKKTTTGAVGRASSRADVSPEGCEKLAGDNIPGNQPPMPSRPEGALENPPPSNISHSSSISPKSVPDSKPKTTDSPADPYAGKKTHEIIAEIEEDYARKQAARLNPEKKSDVQEQENSPLKTQNSTLSKPFLSDYERAILAGKSHLEAMYIQFAPLPPGPKAAPPTGPRPNPLDSFSEPVHTSPLHVFVPRPLPPIVPLG